MNAMQARNLVQRQPETMSARHTCAEAARRMRDEHVGSIVITDGRRPCGVVTDRDLAVRVIAAGLDPEQTLVGEVMTAPAIYLSETADVSQMLETMQKLEVSRLPVIDDDGAAVGVVSVDDVVRELARELARAADLLRSRMHPE
jgi:CBS domain-containing protein